MNIKDSELLNLEKPILINERRKTEMGISKFNTESTRVDWNVETEGWEIKKLRDLEPETEYALKGFFPTADNGYGESAMLISEGFLVGLPARYHDLIIDMLKDEETVEQVKANMCGFKYHTVAPKIKGHKPAFVVDFIEL